VPCSVHCHMYRRAVYRIILTNTEDDLDRSRDTIGVFLYTARRLTDRYFVARLVSTSTMWISMIEIDNRQGMLHGAVVLLIAH